GQDRPAGKTCRRSAFEHRAAWLVTAARAGIDAPSGFVFSVDCEVGWAGDAFSTWLIFEIRAQLGFRLVQIGRRAGELHHNLVCRIGSIERFYFKFGKRASALERAAGAVTREIRVGKQFQAKRRDVLELIGEPKFGGMFGGGIAERQERAVVLR